MKQFYVILFTLISFTSSAQELLKDIVTSNASSHPRKMIEANGRQFFLAKGAENGIPELWVTDGTTQGTTLVANSGNNGPYIIVLGNLVALGNKVLFKAAGFLPGYTGIELWISDGTKGGDPVIKRY